MDRYDRDGASRCEKNTEESTVHRRLGRRHKYALMTLANPLKDARLGDSDGEKLQQAVS